VWPGDTRLCSSTGPLVGPAGPVSRTAGRSRRFAGRGRAVLRCGGCRDEIARLLEGRGPLYLLAAKPRDQVLKGDVALRPNRAKTVVCVPIPRSCDYEASPGLLVVAIDLIRDEPPVGFSLGIVAAAQKHQSAVCLALEIHRFRSACPPAGLSGAKKRHPGYSARVPVVASVGLHRAQIRHGSINDDAPVGHRQILR
jgi:hypothetical protein